MALEERRIRRTKEWLVKAQRDLEAAAILQAQPAPFLDIVVYHCQQAGEKALKAYLFWHDVPFGKTHSLQELLAQCVDVDANPPRSQRCRASFNTAWHTISLSRRNFGTIINSG